MSAFSFNYASILCCFFYWFSLYLLTYTWFAILSATCSTHLELLLLQDLSSHAFSPSFTVIRGHVPSCDTRPLMRHTSSHATHVPSCDTRPLMRHTSPHATHVPSCDTRSTRDHLYNLLFNMVYYYIYSFLTLINMRIIGHRFNVNFNIK